MENLIFGTLRCQLLKAKKTVVDRIEAKAKAKVKVEVGAEMVYEVYKVEDVALADGPCFKRQTTNPSTTQPSQ